jgi:hypothetical protein
MSHKFLNLKFALFLAFMLSATVSWAMDADDQDDAAKEAPAKAQDADAKPTALEQHVASAPPGHAYTHSGKPAAKPPAKHDAAAMAKAATDPSAILTQWGMFG